MRAGTTPGRKYRRRGSSARGQARPAEHTRRALIIAKPKPPPPPRPQLRAGDVVVLRQSQEYVEGAIITVVLDGGDKVHWLTGSNYQNLVRTVTSAVARTQT